MWGRLYWKWSRFNCCSGRCWLISPCIGYLSRTPSSILGTIRHEHKGMINRRKGHRQRGMALHVKKTRACDAFYSKGDASYFRRAFLRCLIYVTREAIIGCQLSVLTYSHPTLVPQVTQKTSSQTWRPAVLECVHDVHKTQLQVRTTRLNRNTCSSLSWYIDRRSWKQNNRAYQRRKSGELLKQPQAK